jgi:hypothetical protein
VGRGINEVEEDKSPNKMCGVKKKGKEITKQQ